MDGRGTDGWVGNASVDGYSRFGPAACLGSWGRVANQLLLEGIQRLRVPGLGVYRDKELADRQSALGRNCLSGKILARWPYHPSGAKWLTKKELEDPQGSSRGWLLVTLAARWAQRLQRDTFGITEKGRNVSQTTG